MRIFLLLFMVFFSFSLKANESCVKEILEENNSIIVAKNETSSSEIVCFGDGCDC